VEKMSLGSETKLAGMVKRKDWGLVLLNSLEVCRPSELLCGSRRFYRFQESLADAVTREGNKVMSPLLGQREC